MRGPRRMTGPHTYDAHESARMLEVHGRPLAPFWRRAAAFIVDFLSSFGIFLAVLLPGGRLAANLGYVTDDVNLKFGFEHWYSLVILVAYFALATWWGNGKTIGKWLFGIRVVSLVHPGMSLWHSVERALGYGASFLEFGFGFIQFFIHPNRRTVHDRIAETIVVLDAKRRNAKGPIP
jgi:uncharacterized RDD family membrane protein YckC